MIKIAFVWGAVLASLFAMETVDLNNPALWHKNVQKFIEKKEKSILVKGPGTRLVATKGILLDAGKKYTVSAKMKNHGTEEAWVLIGFQAATDKQLIECPNVYVTIGSETTLVNELKAGDDVLIVKDASKWNTKLVSAFAINVQKDMSDLPNFNLSRGAIKSIEKQADGTWKITMRLKQTKGLAAGTTIRQHLYGGYIYTSNVKIKPGAEVEVKGTVMGFAKKGTFGNKSWPMGATVAYPLIFSDWSKKNLTIEYTDARIVIE